MAGKPGRSGGARPGAGAKKKTTAEAQACRRDVLLDVFTAEEWRSIATLVRDKVKGGEIGSMLPYLPYLLGSPKQEINVSGEVKATITIPELRKLIGASE